MATEKQRQYARDWYIRNKERLKPIRKAWCDKNRDQVLAYQKEYGKEHAAKISEKRKIHRKLNRELYLERSRNYRLKHREQRLLYQRRYNASRVEQRREYKRKRRSSDLLFRVRETLASRINAAVKRKRSGEKSAKTIELLGCDVPFFKSYISSRFKDGMSWENYGKYWSFDHIIPCAYFDLSSPDEQRKCFHYSNLQPMRVEENRSKSKKLPQQPEQSFLL